MSSSMSIRVDHDEAKAKEITKYAGMYDSAVVYVLTEGDLIEMTVFIPLAASWLYEERSVEAWVMNKDGSFVRQ